MSRVIYFLLASCLSITVCFSAPMTCEGHECLAVVDAGSTGSRLHVYAYDLDNNHTPIHIQEIYSNKIEPGFASLVPSQNNINTYLDKLLGGLALNNIPVIFYATAGMRLVSRNKQKLYYEKLENWFSTQTKWHLESVKTITGREEGVYAWLAVNYALETLKSTEKPRVGVMDTGGGSVQIAFPVKDANGVDFKDIVRFSVYGHDVVLFVHSFLGIGQTEVDHQFIDSRNCFPSGYMLPNGYPAQGDFSSCEDKVTPLITTVHNVNKIVKPIFEMTQVKSWYILGGLNYLVQSEPLLFHNDEFTLDEVAKQSDETLCHQDWITLSTDYPNNDYLYLSCLNATYYYVLLKHGYGFSGDQKINYFPKKTGSPDWPLGVVLYH